MNNYDAAKILGLTGALEPKETKKAYREACKKYHPDFNPAGEDMMKLVNQAYEVLKDFAGNLEIENIGYGELLNDALNAVFGLSDVVVEVCGAWVWITGNTRDYKDVLKGAGYKWASKKKAWYFRPEDYRCRSKSDKSLEDIRGKYGSFRPKHNVGLLSN